MNRRPWPIVLMAILQFLSPVFYLIAAAAFYHLSFGAATNEILALTPPLRKFELFVLPVILGVLILITRKMGYYIVVLGSIYLVIRGVMEFIASNQTDPVFPLIISNLICLAAVVILLRAKTRSVYLNPRLRWWETSPRYVVNLSSSITRVGGKPTRATLENIAAGGAGLETTETGFLKNEIVDLEFQRDGETYRLKSQIVWEKPMDGSKQYLGLQWADDNSTSEWSKLRRLIRGLKTKNTPTTRHQSPRFWDVREWFAKIAG
jgi:hypothetical protein